MFLLLLNSLARACSSTLMIQLKKAISSLNESLFESFCVIPSVNGLIKSSTTQLFATIFNNICANSGADIISISRNAEYPWFWLIALFLGVNSIAGWPAGFGRGVTGTPPGARAAKYNNLYGASSSFHRSAVSKLNSRQSAYEWPWQCGF